MRLVVHGPVGTCGWADGHDDRIWTSVPKNEQWTGTVLVAVGYDG